MGEAIRPSARNADTVAMTKPYARLMGWRSNAPGDHSRRWVVIVSFLPSLENPPRSVAQVQALRTVPDDVDLAGQRLTSIAETVYDVDVIASHRSGWHHRNSGEAEFQHKQLSNRYFSVTDSCTP